MLGAMADGIAGIATNPSTGAPTPAGTVQGAGGPAKATGSPQAAQAKGATGDSLELSPAAKAEVAKLQARDADVRAHEEAHMAAGGSLASGATYDFEKGPDGKMYAVGGEVSIDSSAVKGDPQATLAKAQRVEAAALAPADPSGQDVSVATQAAAMATQAAADLASQNAAKAGGQTQASGAKGNPSGAPAATQAAGATAPQAAGATAPQAAGATAPQAAAQGGTPVRGPVRAVPGYGTAATETGKQAGQLFNAFA